MKKYTIDFSKIFSSVQQKLAQLDQENPGAILQFLKDFKQKKMINEIDKAPYITWQGNHKLHLIHELYFFLVKNYVKKILLPSLEQSLRESLFMFAFGRMFSKYNDIGVQACTDFDFNIIIRDEAAGKKKNLAQAIKKMKQVLWYDFEIETEINPEFTILKFSELKARIGKKTKETFKYILFYKSIEDNYYIFQDNKPIRDYLNSVIRSIPDFFLFEQYLGFFSSNKNSYFRIRRGDPLEIIPDNGRQPQLVTNVIGSELFRKRLKTSSLLLVNRISCEWYFSMKFMVNRVYDYVCAMLARGYNFQELGIEEHDYGYIRQANLIMLILQELKFARLNMYRFKVEHSNYDFSYISSEWIKSFSAINPVRFEEAIRSITYDLKIIPRNNDLRRIEQSVKKMDYSQALWFICTVVEYWISKKVHKLLKGEVLVEIRKQKAYQE